MTRHCMELLQARWEQKFFVCVGLDIDFKKIPNVHGRAHLHPTVEIQNFGCNIVRATKHVACAYKPNIAFFEDQGPDGIRALKHITGDIREQAPDVPVILDFKRGDIGNTNLGYVREAFEFFGADAVTVPPYMGKESLAPFLDQETKGVFILCRTSNPGAGEFQDLMVSPPDGGKQVPLYQYVARQVSDTWNQNGNCGLVVGATTPSELKEVRSIVGDMPILIPGVGAQGGDLKKTVQNGRSDDNQGMVINASRGIIFADDPQNAAEVLTHEIQDVLES